MTLAPRYGFSRVTVRIPDADLLTTRLHGTGYRQACGECPDVLYAGTVRELRRKVADHRSTHAVASSGEDTSPAEGTEA